MEWKYSKADKSRSYISKNGREDKNINIASNRIEVIYGFRKERILRRKVS